MFIKKMIKALLFTASVIAASPALAQEPFPTRGVKIIIPFPPGSALDAITRIVADPLADLWKQSVIVENIAGAAGNIGTDRVARSEPDGYTLLASPPGPLGFNQLLFKDTHFDPASFTPLSLMGVVPNVLVVRKSIEAKTIPEFLALLRANPGKYNYASQGVTSTGYLTMKLFEQRTGTSLVHVPYRGAALALTDIAAGQVDMFFDTVTTSLPLHRGDAARIIGVADLERTPSAPDIPTFHESGVPGFRSITWFGLAAPPKMPSALAEKISRDVASVLRRPDVAERIRNMNIKPVGGSPAETGSFFSEQAQIWTTLIKSLNIEMQ